LGQRGVLADLLIEDDAPPVRTPERVAQPLSPDVRTAP
jgi:hypothetical protein